MRRERRERERSEGEEAERAESDSPRLWGNRGGRGGAEPRRAHHFAWPTPSRGAQVLSYGSQVVRKIPAAPRLSDSEEGDRLLSPRRGR